MFQDLDRFLKACVGQVKLVDRTFNCSKDHAMAIWRYLAEHDNGVTNFHFELAAELLDEEMLSFLSTVRPGRQGLESDGRRSAPSVESDSSSSAYA